MDFFKTGMGRRFFDHQLPELISAIGDLNDRIDALVDEVQESNRIERKRLDWEQEKEALGR